MKNTKFKLISALLLMMAVGFGQTAQATTKTVSYDITFVDPGYLSCSVIITRTGDTPFEGGQLGKFYFGEQNANIYIPRNHDEYAIIHSDRRSDVALHFKTKELGYYTISFASENTDLSGIQLIDLFTNDIIDLSENPAYTFIGSPADRAARFKLVFSNTAEGNDTFAYQNGDNIIVDGEGELQVFDVMGRLVANQRINGVETIAKPEPTGVYIFKLNGMTQKIVIR